MARRKRLDGYLKEVQKQLVSKEGGALAEKLEMLYQSCHPKQRDFAFDPGRRIAALVARGGGKTTGVKTRILKRMLSTPKARCVFIATSRSQGEELMWSSLKDTADKLELNCRFFEQKLRMVLYDNGSTLRIVGADDKREIEKLRGMPFHEVCIDEGASYDRVLLERLVYRIIGPRMGDFPNSSLTIIGTPGHLFSGVFYDVTRPGSDISRPYEDRKKPEYKDWLRWSSHRWTLKDGAPYVPAMKNLWKEALIEKEANGWSDENPVWRREYLGQWAADDTERMFKYRPHDEAGNQYNQWNPKKDRNGMAILPEGHDWRYVYGMDMGHSDPFALEVFAYSMQDRTLYHVYEFNQKGMYAQTIAKQLIGDELDSDNPRGVVGATGWPDAMDADMSHLGGAMLDELRNVYGIHINPAERKHKHDAIELFNGDLIDGRIKVLKGSILEQQLLHLQWDTDDYGNLKEPKSERNDATDAAIYARRRAHHQFSGDADPIVVKTAAQMQVEQEEEAAGLKTDEYSDLFGYDDFDQFF